MQLETKINMNGHHYIFIIYIFRKREMTEEAERLKMIFSSQGSEALEEALKNLPIDSPARVELIEWCKTFEDE